METPRLRNTEMSSNSKRNGSSVPNLEISSETFLKSSFNENLCSLKDKFFIHSLAFKYFFHSLAFYLNAKTFRILSKLTVKAKHDAFCTLTTYRFVKPDNGLFCKLAGTTPSELSSSML